MDIFDASHPPNLKPLPARHAASRLTYGNVTCLVRTGNLSKTRPGIVLNTTRETSRPIKRTRPDAPEVSVAVEGLGRPYRLSVDHGHVNFRGRRVSWKHLVKKAIKKEYRGETHEIINGISSHVSYEVLNEHCVVVLLSEPQGGGEFDVKYEERSGPQPKRQLRAPTDDEMRWAKLPAPHRNRRERAIMLGKLASKPITTEEQEIFDQAFESLQREPD